VVFERADVSSVVDSLLVVEAATAGPQGP